MSEFIIENKPLDTNKQSGDSLKNIKELKAGNGNFYVDASGKIELRDTAGNVTVSIDPNG